MLDISGSRRCSFEWLTVDSAIWMLIFIGKFDRPAGSSNSRNERS